MCDPYPVLRNTLYIDKIEKYIITELYARMILCNMGYVGYIYKYILFILIYIISYLEFHAFSAVTKRYIKSGYI